MKIYLDNASTSFYKPKCVKKIVKKGLKHYTANSSRGGHLFSEQSGKIIAKTRELLANTFNCNFERVLFTSGCTESLNLAILGTKKEKGHLIVSCFEHNSVLRVVEYLKRECGIEYTVVYPKSKNGRIAIDELEQKIKCNTYGIIINHISNVTGVTQDIFQIGKLAKKYKLLFIVDGAQSAGHEEIDMKKYNISLLALAGHKGLFGLQGVGALCVNADVTLKPIKFGGTGTFSECLRQPEDFPDGFESGTHSAINIASFGIGTSFAYNNLISHKKKILKLTKFLTIKMLSNNLIKLYSLGNEQQGIVSFNVTGLSPQYIASELNKKGVAVRAGYCCAPLVQKFLGTESCGGVVRVSIGCFNKMRDIKTFLKNLNSLILKR